MEAVESYRYVGVLACSMAWLAIAVVLYKWPIVTSKSISKHVSSSRQAWLLFAPIETTALVLLYVFMDKWLIPVLLLPTSFKALVAFAVIMELVTTWVPDTDGVQHRIHHYTAYAAALPIPVIVFFIAASPQTHTIAKALAYMAVAISVLVISLFAIGKDTKAKHLVYQSIYFACFHIPILAVIFSQK